MSQCGSYPKRDRCAKTAATVGADIDRQRSARYELLKPFDRSGFEVPLVEVVQRDKEPIERRRAMDAALATRPNNLTTASRSRDRSMIRLLARHRGPDARENQIYLASQLD
jgi:hypothetical protein